MRSWCFWITFKATIHPQQKMSNSCSLALELKGRIRQPSLPPPLSSLSFHLVPLPLPPPSSLPSFFLKWHEGWDGWSPRSSRLRPHRWGEIKVLCELLTVLPFSTQVEGTWGREAKRGGGAEPPAAVTSPPYHISCITCSSTSSPKRQISSVISERISI